MRQPKPPTALLAFLFCLSSATAIFVAPVAFAKSISKLSAAPLIAIKIEKYERRQIKITSLIADGQNIICGIYKFKKQPNDDITHGFGWVNGKLVMKFGPVWNKATTCLIKNYQFPLP